MRSPVVAVLVGALLFNFVARADSGTLTCGDIAPILGTPPTEGMLAMYARGLSGGLALAQARMQVTADSIENLAPDGNCASVLKDASEAFASLTFAPLTYGEFGNRIGEECRKPENADKSLFVVAVRSRAELVQQREATQNKSP